MSTQDLRGVACVRSVSVGFREQRKIKERDFRFFAASSVFLCSPNPRKSLLREQAINSQNEIQKISSRGSCSPKCAKFDDFTLFFAVNVTRCTKIYNARVLLFLCLLNLLVTFSFPLPLGFALSYVQVTDFINKFINKFL